MGLVYLSIYRNSTNTTHLHQIFNKNFGLINDLCDEDNILDMSKRDLDIKSFTPIILGLPRE